MEKEKVYVTPLGGVYETAETSFLYETMDKSGKIWAMLIDYGGNPSPTSSDETEHEASRKFRRIPGAENISDLLVTHPHFDHLGWALTIAHEFGLTLHLSQGAYYYLEIMAKRQGLKLENLEIHILKEKEPFDIGPFQIVPREYTHSVVGSFGFDITVFGKIITHMCDNKLTGMTEATREKNLAKLRECQNVDLMITDTLYAHRPGISPPEGPVVLTLFDLVEQKPEKNITHFIFMNSRNQDRVVTLWAALYRKGINIRFAGSAMHDLAHILEKRFQEKSNEGRPEENGEFKIKLLEIADPKTHVVFGTGSQAEEGSYLLRLVASKEIQPGDRIYLAATLIPGAFYRAKIQLMRELLTEAVNQGAEVFVHYGQAKLLGLHESWNIKESLLHVPSHELGDGIKMVVEAKRPKRLLPFHFLTTIEVLRDLLGGLTEVICPVMDKRMEV